MPYSCAVADCSNRGKRRKDDKENIFDVNLKYFSFPVKDQNLCMQWIKLCRRKKTFNPKTSRICSDHFTEDDISRDLQSELLGLPPKRELKPTAVPSVFPHRSNKPEAETQRTKRLKERSRKKLVEEIIRNADEQNLPVSVENNEGAVKQVTVGEKVCQTDIRGSDVEWLQKEVLRLRHQLERKGNVNRRLKLRITSLCKRHQIRAAQKRSGEKHESKSTKKVRWENNDIVQALQVRCVSMKAYQVARSCWDLPLPSPSTLRRWISNFSCDPGILSEVLHIMNSEAENMLPIHRICAMSVDEMSVSSRFLYDYHQDVIVSYSKVQVAMIRGICDTWKQPVYFEFDTRMIKERLFAIIHRVEQAGFPVILITCDLAGENRSLLNDLGIHVDITKGIFKTSFENPFDKERNIWAFADTPHMLKLLRNHLLDDGVLLSDGTIIKKETLEKLLRDDNDELKLCPKFNLEHLEVVKAERMRVCLASQLLSMHVATLCQKKYPDQPQISTFFRTINDGFDVLNSRCKQDFKCPMKSGYCELGYQVKALNDLQSLVQIMRFYDKRSPDMTINHLHPFQIGFLVTINSTKEMFSYLKTQFGVEYLLTSRTNQDSLESTFSILRGIGGPNTQPTPLELRYRFRIMLLGKFSRRIRGTNIQMDNSDRIMTSGLLKKNAIVSEPLNQNLAKCRTIVGENEPGINDDDALFYLAGYLAWKLKRAGKGKKIYGTVAKTTRSSSVSWLSMLSRGSLLTPTAEMHEWVRKCNHHFLHFMTKHGREMGLSKRLFEFIARNIPDIDKAVLAEFIKMRIKIRVSYLNRRTKSRTNVIIKKAKHFARSAKKI